MLGFQICDAGSRHDEVAVPGGDPQRHDPRLPYSMDAVVWSVQRIMDRVQSRSTITGTWSEGSSQLRADLTTSMRRREGASGGVTQTWSKRQP